MALFICPYCGKEISDRGAICPYCKNWLNTGAYRQLEAQKKAERIEAYLQFESKKTEEQTEVSYEKQERIKKREDELSRLPACPVCGSKEKVKRIGNINRTLSVWVWGLASSKIGKRYECTRCKYLW